MKNFKSSIGQKRDEGFTLLEVVISLALIAISFVVLLELHISSLEMERVAKEITSATFLAQQKTEELKLEGAEFTGIQKRQLDSKYPNFRWDSSATNTPVAGLYKLVVTVYRPASGTERKKELAEITTYLQREGM